MKTRGLAGEDEDEHLVTGVSGLERFRWNVIDYFYAESVKSFA